MSYDVPTNHIVNYEEGYLLTNVQISREVLNMFLRGLIGKSYFEVYLNGRGMWFLLIVLIHVIYGQFG